MKNAEHLSATTARIQSVTMFETARLQSKGTNHLLPLGGCEAPNTETRYNSISEDELQTALQIAGICHFDTAALLTEYHKADARLSKFGPKTTDQLAHWSICPRESVHTDLATGHIIPPWPNYMLMHNPDLIGCSGSTPLTTNSIRLQNYKCTLIRTRLDTVRQKGYKQRPVRSHFNFDSKYDICTGNFLKPKARWVVQGGPTQMTKGVHYFQSYSLAPSTMTTRMMQSIACGDRQTTSCSRCGDRFPAL